MAASVAPLSVFETLIPSIGSLAQTLPTSIAGPGLTGLITQAQNRLFPFAIPGVSETITLLRYGIIEKEQFDKIMKSHGVDIPVSNLLLESAMQRPGPHDLITLFRRGRIDDDPEKNTSIFFKKMAEIGFNTEDARLLARAAEFIPPVSDKVRFMVKEAYTPELVSDLVEGEPTPELFKQQTALQGVSEEDAERYWIAHYDPMSRTDAEEAFHRLNADALKFKQEDLAALGIDADKVQFEFADLLKNYKLVDKYPKNRMQYAMLAYKPLTRIDIRRLDDLLDLPLDKLEFYNREFGYSPATAKELAKFTKVGNLLKDLKPLLMSADISMDEAREELQKVGATKEEADRQLERIAFIVKKAKLSKERDLVKSDMMDAYKLDIITREQLVTNLQSLNYDADEAEFLAKIADAKKSLQTKTTTSKEKNLTRADVVKQYKLGQITRDEASSKLIDLKYDAEEADAILDIADAEIEKAAAKK